MALRTSQHKCPLCGSKLSRDVYEQVLHLDSARHKEIARIKDTLRDEQRRIASERKRFAHEVQTAVAKASARQRKEQERLREQLTRMKAQLAQKASHSAQDRERMARRIAEKTEARFQTQIRRLEDARERAEQRRQRETQSWQKQLADMQRRADSRDSMHFGPEGEEELAAVLKRQFPSDEIQRRGRGVDILHRVVDKHQPCGIIIYECKRTATWQLSFARQLKRSMEAHNTRWGLLVTRALPSRQSGLCVVSGVIAVSPGLAHHIAGILRDTIVELHRADLSQTRRDSKADEIMRYLRSNDFLSALGTVEDRIQELRGALEKEKTTHHSWWEIRERHYSTIARKTTGIGDRISEIVTSKRMPRRPRLRLSS